MKEISLKNLSKLTHSDFLDPNLPYLLIVRKSQEFVAVLNSGNKELLRRSYPQEPGKLSKKLGNIKHVGLLKTGKSHKLFILSEKENGEPSLYQIGGSSDDFPVSCKLYSSLPKNHCLMTAIHENADAKNACSGRLLLTETHLEFFKAEFLNTLATLGIADNNIEYVDNLNLLQERIDDK